MRGIGDDQNVDAAGFEGFDPFEIPRGKVRGNKDEII